MIAIMKNNGEMWDQEVRMKEMGKGAMATEEKKAQPLFTLGDGRKREQGETLIQCNVTNDIWATYKGKYGELMSFVS